MNTEPGLRVCYFGTYDNYTPRNTILPFAMQLNQIEVLPCHAELWGGTDNRIHLASGGWTSPRFIFRWIRALFSLFWQYIHLDSHDVVLVGYPGILDVYLAWLLTRFSKKPLIYDALMSLHLITVERGIANRHPISSRVLFGSEKLTCHLADLILLDTPVYRDYFCQTYNLPTDKFVLLPLGADTRIFSPGDNALASGTSEFRVMHYSTFIPGTGVDVIIQAADLLRDEKDIVFELVGDGQTRAQMEELATHLNLKNVRFVGWINKPDLPACIASADVCLGVFSQGQQASMTVVNKIYECLAMAKPLITGDSTAVRSALRHLEEVCLCERENPAALAEAILMFKRDPQLGKRLAQQGHLRFIEEFTPHVIGAKLKTALINQVAGVAKEAASV
jgi:glycosyltransferase involved in cell wall biosynthesis